MGKLLSWSNREGEEVRLHFRGFIKPSLGNDFKRLREDLGIVVLSPSLNTDFSHRRDIISVQSHWVGVVSFKWTRDNGVSSENFLADTIEIREFQQSRDRETFVGIREGIDQFLAELALDLRLEGQFESNVRGGG